MFKYVKQKDINKSKWSDLVHRSSDSTIFCEYDYLNAFCEWDAIIYGDYEGAIALPYTSFLGIRSLYQPNFVQQCIWFGKKISDSQVQEVFLLIRKMNHRIGFNSNLKLKGNSRKRVNQVLTLRNYETIRNNYSKSLKKNIIKNNPSLIISRDTNPKRTIRLYQEAYGSKNTQIKPEHYSAFQVLINEKPDQFINVHAFNNKKLVASIVLAKSRNRLHYILGAPTEKGRRLNALSVIIDHLIQQESGKEMIFDFEGSSIPSVYQYYASFGAVEEYFYTTEFCRWWLKPIDLVYKRLFKS